MHYITPLNKLFCKPMPASETVGNDIDLVARLSNSGVSFPFNVSFLLKVLTFPEHKNREYKPGLDKKGN